MKQITLSEQQLEELKNAGFFRYEISHFKAGRWDRVSKQKIKQIKKIIMPRKKRSTKPFIIDENGIRLKKSKNIIILK